MGISLTLLKMMPSWELLGKMIENRDLRFNDIYIYVCVCAISAYIATTNVN